MTTRLMEKSRPQLIAHVGLQIATNTTLTMKKRYANDFFHLTNEKKLRGKLAKI